MMSEKLDWTQKLGDAFLAQQADVMATAQSLRQKAVAQGSLKDSEQQKVITTQENSTTVIKIEPTNPEVVYVPTYNPTVVYGAWPYPAYPPYYYYPPGYVAGGALLGFTAGVIVGGALWGNCNWGGGDVNINVNRYNNFNRTNISNGNWKHNGDHRGAVPYRDQGVAQAVRPRPVHRRRVARRVSAGARMPGASRSSAARCRRATSRARSRRPRAGRAGGAGNPSRLGSGARCSSAMRHARRRRADARLQQPRLVEHEFGAPSGNMSRRAAAARARRRWRRRWRRAAAVAAGEAAEDGDECITSIRAGGNDARCQFGTAHAAWRVGRLLLLLLSVCCLFTRSVAPRAPQQKTFATPDDAVNALVAGGQGRRRKRDPCSARQRRR